MSVGYTLKNGHWVWHQTPLKDKESRKRYAAYRANPSTYKVYHYNPKAAARAKPQALARAKAKADGERRKKNGILSSIKGYIWNHLSPGGRLFAYGSTKAPGYLWDHGFLSASACLMVCLNFGFQRGVISFGLTGGLTFGGSKGLFKGPAGDYAGVSAGINTAVPGDQKFQVGSVTAAESRLGGNFSWGRRTSGGELLCLRLVGWQGCSLAGSDPSRRPSPPAPGGVGRREADGMKEEVRPAAGAGRTRS
jgi:hypothetical protein